MGRFIVGLFAVIGFLVVLLIGMGAAGIWVWVSRPDAAYENRWIALTVDFRQTLSEGPGAGPLAQILGDEAMTLRDTVRAIDKAAADPEVELLVAHFGGDAFGMAAAQEIRDAVTRFRAAGKPAVAYADAFGEFGPGNISYYAATAFDTIWLREVGGVGLTGIAAEVPFAREGLDDLGFDAQFARRGIYKSFPESLTESGFTPPHREMIESLTGDLQAQLVAGIAEGRDRPVASVRDLIDRGPFTAREALEAGLIDGLASGEALAEEIFDRHGVSLTTPRVSLSDYARWPVEIPEDAPTIALIEAEGLIVEGEGATDPLLGLAVMGADTIARAIDGAAASPAVEAIVLRIDSGGGSAVASDIIGQAIRRAGENGKPVVVSMGNAAASGGYWVAAPADLIIAQPATLTGSIGVFAGKIVTEEFWESWGVNWEAVPQAQNALMWSSGRRYSPSEVERLNAFLDATYAAFIERVATGRDLDPTAVEAIAGGRVWTGAQALELGLVDRLGGLNEAFAAARELIDAEPDVPLEVRVMPEPPSLLDRLLSLVGGFAGSGANGAFDRLRPLVQRLEPLLFDPSAHVARMPPILIGG
ncbi:signal peptide peptidase SppA [Inquilinus sp. CAU 1745]|uniref:signal peptide peptidase SppA n=1 Tax=Inquilinus sp. CAU 1745 TaxID=3140369 RepID=UPI00325B95B1